jgi:hypothetical protein
MHVFYLTMCICYVVLTLYNFLFTDEASVCFMLFNVNYKYGISLIL